MSSSKEENNKTKNNKTKKRIRPPKSEVKEAESVENTQGGNKKYKGKGLIHILKCFGGLVVLPTILGGIGAYDILTAQKNAYEVGVFTESQIDSQDGRTIYIDPGDIYKRKVPLSEHLTAVRLASNLLGKKDGKSENDDNEKEDKTIQVELLNPDYGEGISVEVEMGSFKPIVYLDSDTIKNYTSVGKNISGEDIPIRNEEGLTDVTIPPNEWMFTTGVEKHDEFGNATMKVLYLPLDLTEGCYQGCVDAHAIEAYTVGGSLQSLDGKNIDVEGLLGKKIAEMPDDTRVEVVTDFGSHNGHTIVRLPDGSQGIVKDEEVHLGNPVSLVQTDGEVTNEEDETSYDETVQ